MRGKNGIELRERCVMEGVERVISAPGELNYSKNAPNR